MERWNEELQKKMSKCPEVKTTRDTMALSGRFRRGKKPIRKKRETAVLDTVEAP